MSNELRLQKPRPAWKRGRRSVRRSDEGGARGRHSHGGRRLIDRNGWALSPSATLFDLSNSGDEDGVMYVRTEFLSI